MPIAIRETFEPFSRAATVPGTGSGGSILIESEAYRLLKQEAERYVRGEVRGRSFLIAGHRGSGKTTMVLHVCQELLNLPPARDRRVLPVFLHGPNLLPDPNPRSLGAEARAPNEKEKAKQGAKPEDADKESAVPGKKSEAGGKQAQEAVDIRRPAGALSEDETENALIQITLELYRALAREVTFRFRSTVLPEADRPATRTQLARLELAAQLEAELDLCPDPARLREVWARYGFLPEGVLFRDLRQGVDEVPIPRGPFLTRLWIRYRHGVRLPNIWWRSGTVQARTRPADQGFRELLALSSACEMYRRISGSFTRESGSKSEAAREAAVGVSVPTKGQDLVAPVAALITGGLAGVAASAAGAGASPLTAAFTGLVAAFGAATVFKVSSTRSRKRSYVEESKFVRDLTVSTLDREIPILIERCLDAGLVPLFLVDELDKVENLSERITSLVRRLKKLVAERAFFCFLTDRQYFEEMQGRTRSQAYPIEYTYFTDHLFVVFNHRDFHRYLLRAVAPAEPIARFESERSTGSGAVEFDGGATPDEMEDCRILRYILLHRAKMHTIDLRRLLARHRDQNGHLDMPPGAWRSRAHLCDLLLQVAVEMVLEGQAMREWLRREPGFRRLAHDALYYPSRRWEDKEYELDLSDGQLEDFGRYLVNRMGRDPKKQQEENENVQKPIPPEPELVVAARDRGFLFERVRELAHLLSNAEAFQRAFRQWENSPDTSSISEDLRLTWAAMESHAALVLPLLDRQDEEEHHYHWRLDYSGLELRRPEALKKEAEADAAFELTIDGSPFAEAERIRSFAQVFDALRPVTLTTLTSELRILSISPAWPEVERALEHLEHLGRDSRPLTLTSLPNQSQQALRAVHDFQELLDREWETLGLAIVCGAVLGRAVKEADPFAHQLLAGLRAIARIYRFEAKTTEDKRAALRSLKKELTDRAFLSDVHKAPPQVRTLTAKAWDTWLRDLRLGIDQNERLVISLPDHRQAAWLAWDERFFEIVSAGSARTQFQPTLAELWCAAADVPPADLLLPDLEAMSVHDWSRVFFAAIMGSSKKPGDFPVRAAVPALYALGFRLDYPTLLIDALVRAERSRRIQEVMKLAPYRPFTENPWEADFPPPAPGLRHVLLIRRSRGSLTEGWMPPRRGALLSLTQQELSEETLVEARGSHPPLIATLQLDLIVVELPPPEESGVEVPPQEHSKGRTRQRGARRTAVSWLLTFSQPASLINLLATWGRRPALLYIAADSSYSAHVPSDVAVLYAPSDADEVLAKAPLAPNTGS